MMLRASSQASDVEIDLGAVTAGGSAGDVPHAVELTGFVDAVVDGDQRATADARAALVEVTDGATMVDAAAVIGNFEMMTRIADGTGTAHPANRLQQIEDLRDELDLDSYRSARL